MELRDKLTVMLKLSLEYNAAIIAQASILYSAKNPREKDVKRVIKQMQDLQKRYSEDLGQVLIETEAS